jgi:hypothetical protein
MSHLTLMDSEPINLGKEPWRFKKLEDQLNIYHQQWQADQQKKIIAKMAGKMPGKSNDEKRKNNQRNQHNTNCGLSGVARAIMADEDAEDAEELEDVAAEEAATIVSI